MWIRKKKVEKIDTDLYKEMQLLQLKVSRNESEIIILKEIIRKPSIKKKLKEMPDEITEDEEKASEKPKYPVPEGLLRNKDLE